MTRAAAETRARRLFRALRRLCGRRLHLGVFWRERMTLSGRFLILLFSLGAVSSSVLPTSYPLFLFPCLLLGLLSVTGLAGWWWRPRAQIERSLPARCAVGATVEVRALVRNTGPRPVYDLAVTESAAPEAMGLEPAGECLDLLPPGAAAELRYRFHPAARGAYDLPGPMAVSAFPFGLHRAACVREDARRVLVYPRFTPLEAVDLPVGRKHQPGGLQLVSQVGDSEEFIGNREYRPGDRLRDIHHAAWARTGLPVVREFQQEYLCRIALVVDTHLPAASRRTVRAAPWRRRAPSPAREAFEAGIALAASVADALSRQEYVVDLFAAGPELYHLQAGRSLAYLDNILDVLACIEPCPENPFARLAPALLEEIGRISTLVLVLLDWDEARDQFVRAIREANVAVKVVLVRDGAPPPSLALAATDAGPPVVLTPAQVARGAGRL